MRYSITILIGCAIFASVFYLIIPAEISSAAETIHVYSGEYIQDAIDAANASSTIYVHSGTYNENLVIDKTLTLTGESVSSVILNGNGGHTITVYNNSIQLSGFTIKNTNELKFCIFLSSISNCLIENNKIKNGAYGIYLQYSDDNTIKDNIVELNNIGIYLSHSDSNTIRSNTIIENNANGIFIPSTSNGNTIYLNDFDDNQYNARDEGTNDWNYNSQGNYWDDYNDYDSNSDGIGDNPYTIDGVPGNKDYYPKGDFLTANNKPIATINNPGPSITKDYGDSIYFSGIGDDPDPGDTIESYRWTSDIDGQLSTQQSFTTTSLSVGTHTISFKVMDNHYDWSSAKTVVAKIQEIGQENQIPIAYILKPNLANPVIQGNNVEFLGRWADDGQVVEYSWRSSHDGKIGSTESFTKSDLSIGTHTIFLKVKDDYGQWSSEASTTITIIADPFSTNNAPIADTGGPYIGYINIPLTFDGSDSYDLDNDDSISSYDWDFGDGSTGIGKLPKHTYSSEGNYSIELIVTDSKGAKSSKTITFANVSKSADVNNGNSKDNETPGFELIFVILSIIFITILEYKRRK